MDWLSKLNESLEYIESHLASEISYEAAAKIACCSTFHYQRMFSYIAGVSLSEYIRRRRMTAAAFDLQKGEKVMDVAIKYGYESPTSFNRAFQTVHGITPSAARKDGTKLKAYPKISFQITIKGEVEMDYSIEKKEAFRIVGAKVKMSHQMEENFKMIPEFWNQVGQNGTLEKIIACMDGSVPQGVMGISACQKDEDWYYYIGVASEKELQDGLEEYQMPAGTWVIFPGNGPMPTAIQEVQKRAITEWLPTSGYEYANGADVELYLNQDPANAQFEIWVPIQEKSK